jgi:hypothetical protein
VELEYIDEPYVYPSRTGKDVIDFERYAHLPRAATYNNVQSFLERARKSKEVNVLFIEAEWGEGKTSICEGLLQKMEVIKSDIVIKVDTSTLVKVIEERGQDFRDTPIIGIRLFASVLLAIKGVLESKVEKKSPIDKINIVEKSADISTINFIEENLKRIFAVLPSTSKLFIFLDEFEDIVDQTSDMQSFINGGLVNIINGQPEHLCKGENAGRIHLIIAVTPTAYATIKSKVHANIGRLFGQRAFEVSLEKLTRKYAYDFMLGYLIYCWNGKIPKLPFTTSGMLNAIYNATYGNPRAIMTVLEILLSKAKTRAPEGKIELITPLNFTQDLSGTKISVYGADVCLLDKQCFNDLHAKVEEESLEWKLDLEKAKGLLDLLIADHSPISEEYIKKELGIDEKYSMYLNIIGKAFEKLWNIRAPFLFFRKVVGGEEELYAKTKSSTSKLSNIIDASKFYEYNKDSSTFSSAIFVPNKSLNDLRLENEAVFRNFIEYFRSLIPEIKDEDQIVLPIDAEMLPKVKTSKEEYVMLAPPALSILYPPPSVVFLDFIEDLDKRFEIGTEIMRDTTAFEESFRKGVSRLLKDGCHRVSIEEGYEHYGVKGVQIHNVKYKILGGAEECRFRAYLLHKLNWGLEKTKEEVSEEIKRMEIANIPLLLIFTWNPVPTDIKASVIETFLPRKVMHFIEFPLTTIQTYQLIALDVAEERKYKIKEDRWKVRARRIIEETKFEDILEEWINKGYDEGYAIRPLIFKGGVDDLHKALRTFLIFEGRSIKESFEFLKNIEKKFKIHGVEFGINPLDIESPTQLKDYAEELEKHGFLKLDGQIATNITPVESRILEILKYYKKPMSHEELQRFFVISGGGKITPYINALIERKLLVLAQEGAFKIISLEDLEKRAQDYKVSLEKSKKHYENYYLGYLASVKQKAVHSIILSRCIDDLLELYKELDKKRFKDEHGWRATYLHFELMKKHIDRIDALIQDFDKIVEQKRKGIDIESTKRGLSDLEKSVPNYFPEVGKIIRIDEKRKLEEKIEKIKEIRNSKYSDEELHEKGKQISEKKEEIKNEGLAETYKGCPVFDVKAIVLYSAYEDLKTFIESCNLEAVTQNLKAYDDLRKKTKEHELFRLKFDQKEEPISSIMLNWIITNIPSEKKKTTQETIGTKEEITLKINEVVNLIAKNKKAYEEQVNELDNFTNKLKELQTKESSFNQKLLSAESNLQKLNLFFEGEVISRINVAFQNLNAIEKERDKKREELDLKTKQKFEKSIFMQIVEEYEKFFDEKIPQIFTIQDEARSEFREKIALLHGKLSMISRLLSSIKKTLEGT